MARRKVFFPDNLFKPASVEQEIAEVEEMQALGGASSDVAPNDTGLPSPKDATARMVEAWCKQGSWGMCQKCGSMQPRPLQPVDLRRVAPPTISEKACTACRHGEYVPQPNDIPQELRGLKPRVVRTLRPLDIDVGTFQRAQYGYRIHSSMVTFAWAAQPVQDKISGLRKQKDRASARAALEYLARERHQQLQVLLRPPLRLLGPSWSGPAGEAAKIAAPLPRRGRFGVRALAAPVLAARSL